MASSIQILRSTVARERPFPGSLLEGQPAVNLNASEPGLFFRASDGSLLKMGPVALTFDGAAPNSSPAGQTGNCVGELWYDGSTNPGTLKVFNGSTWLSSGSPNAITDIIAGSNVTVSRSGNAVTISATGGGGGGGSSTLLRWIISASAGQTSLSGLDDGGNLLSYTPGLEEVFVNGVLLTRGVDYTATTGSSITGISALTAGDVVTVLAYSTLSVTMPSADSVTYNPGITNSVQRSVAARLRDFISSTDFGTVGDGTNDDRFALNFLQASSTSYVLLKPGTYFLGGDYTFYKPVIFMPGAVIKWGGVSNVYFTSTLSAEPVRIFENTGTGRVFFTSVTEGYPEWWGAVINSGAGTIPTTNLAAINACIQATSITKFRAADYYIDGTILVTTRVRTLQGAKKTEFPGLVSGQTRIVNTSASADNIHVYTPGSLPFAQWNQHVELYDLQFGRSQFPLVPAPGNEINGPCGLRADQIVWLFVTRCTFNNDYTGVLLNGTVGTHLYNVTTQRYTVGQGPNAATNDKYFGYWLNGYVNYGFAGGNASTRMTDCAFGGVVAAIRDASVAWYLPGAYVDTFLDRVEAAGVGTGVLIDASGLSPSLQKSGCADLHIDTIILDGITQTGIKIINTSDWTAINISGGYAAPSFTANPNWAGIHIEDSIGLVSISNWQSICWPTPSGRGLYIKNSSGVRSVGGMHVGSQRPIELDGASKCSIEDGIKNNVGEATTQAAVLLSNSTKNYIRPIIYGAPSIFNRGVDVPAGSSFNEINCTNIDSGSISTGVGRVLRVNGVSVTTPGTYSTNLASGIIS